MIILWAARPAKRDRTTKQGSDNKARCLHTAGGWSETLVRLLYFIIALLSFQSARNPQHPRVQVSLTVARLFTRASQQASLADCFTSPITPAVLVLFNKTHITAVWNFAVMYACAHQILYRLTSRLGEKHVVFTQPEADLKL